MSEERTQGVPDRWLLVEGEGQGKTVHCPRLDRGMPLHECFGCKRYASLAIDPAGKHVYLDCAWDDPDSGAACAR
jgi:hypothetical protein